MSDFNPHLLARLQAVRDAMMAQHLAGAKMPSAVRGAEREVFLREFLQKVFPSHRRFATGAITDSLGAISGQVDIAIEYGFLPSFPMPASEERLLLAESVAMVIEVKSNLSNQWTQLAATTKQVKKLTRNLQAIMTIGGPLPDNIPVLAVGYTGYASSAALQNRLDETPADSRPDGALVIDSGSFTGFGIRAEGPVGLYAMCLAIDAVLRQLGFAGADLIRYVPPRPDA